MSSTAAEPSPPDSALDWSQFDRDLFLKAAFDACSTLQTHTDAFLGANYSPPGAAAPEALPRTAKTISRLLDVVAHRITLDTAGRAAALAQLFPAGTPISGDERAPDDLVTGLFLPIFKNVYPWLRRIMMTYATPCFRENWNAFHPTSWPRHIREGTDQSVIAQAALFNEIFRPLVSNVHQILGILVLCCSAARRRVADDIPMLEALFWSLVVHPAVTPFFLKDYTSSLIQPGAASLALFEAFLALQAILVANPRTYKRHIQSQTELGLSTAFSSASQSAAYFHLRYLPNPDYRPKETSDPASTPEDVFLNQCLDVYYDSVGALGQLPDVSSDSAVLRESIKTEHQNLKHSIVTHYVCPDTCDYCQRTVEETKLMRCSRCRFSRYCSRDCQLAGWKEGYIWRIPGREFEFHEVPHKFFCFDGKEMDIRRLLGWKDG